MTKNQKALAKLDALENMIGKLKHATDELDHDLDMLTGIIDEIIEPRPGPGKTLMEVFADEEKDKHLSEIGKVKRVLDTVLSCDPQKLEALIAEREKQLKDAENRAILEQFMRIHNVPDEAPLAGRRIHVVELQELTPEALFDVLGQVAAFEEACNAQEADEDEEEEDEQ